MEVQFVSKHYFINLGSNLKVIFDSRDMSIKLNLDDIDTKIKIYEDRVKTWFLEVAEFLTFPNERILSNKQTFSTSEAGFVILMICASYIEGNQQYRNGLSSNGKSADFFNEGFKRIFKHDQPDLYNRLRCGLFHDGMTRKGISISSDFKTAINFKGKSIKINPTLFLESIKSDFEKYILELKTNKILRENFNMFFDSK